MIVAMGQGARARTLFRHAEAIERMHASDTVLFHMTGKPAVIVEERKQR